MYHLHAYFDEICIYTILGNPAIHLRYLYNKLAKHAIFLCIVIFMQHNISFYKEKNPNPEICDESNLIQGYNSDLCVHAALQGSQSPVTVAI